MGRKPSTGAGHRPIKKGVPLLEITPRTEGRTGHLRLNGDLDAAAEARFLDAGRGLIDTGCRDLRVDAADVSFIDSRGLSALLVLNSTCRSLGGSLFLVGESPLVRRMIAVTGLEDLLGCTTAT
jgi:anti-anti-sigma factor